ncbi:MAG: 50S ribosomal protein L1 [Anaerolineae bacterium]|nr:50S ribosomal protein L1 [Anaerolineae bacterium]MDW8102676.1 50S ribosomal protein L1 [Anaerolineae bacterium]
MGKRGKKYQEVAKLVDKNKEYTPEEAIELAKKTIYTRFDPTVELHIRTGVDPRHADQQIRGVALLPHGTGKRVKILVFAEGEAAKIAQEAGADYVGGDELIEKIMGGWLDFDLAIAVPQIMGKVAKLGKILGPRKLMPSPKSGTVVPPDDLPRVIEEARKGRVEFRVDKTGNLHIPIGKASFTTQQLLENMAAVMDTIMKIRPSGLKGQYIKKVYLTTTMGPSIKVNTALATSLKPAE